MSELNDILYVRLLHEPSVVTPAGTGEFEHYYGGPLGVSGLPAGNQFIRVLTLDLRDPALAALPFSTCTALPLLMDFREGSIGYRVLGDGVVEYIDQRPGYPGEPDSADFYTEEQLREIAEAPPLRAAPFPREDVGVRRLSYAEYRALALDDIVIEPDFLSDGDRALVDALGESYTQINGKPMRVGSPWGGPCCLNRACIAYDETAPGYEGISMLTFVGIGQEPTATLSFEDLPLDPAIRYSFCEHCEFIYGWIPAG